MVIAFVVFAFLVFFYAIFRFLPKSLNFSFPSTKNQNLPTPRVVVPTKTPQEIEVISKMETKEIVIANDSLTPKALTIKAFDQVQFTNKSDKTITIAGEGWSGSPLKAGRKAIRAFDQVGTFTYTVSGLTSSLTGKVVVK